MEKINNGKIITNEIKERNETNKNKSKASKNNTSNKKLPRVYLYFIYFILFAFVGWVLETCFSFYALGHFTKRGFLYGPLCPIYGWGALILIMSFGRYRKNNLKLFIYSAIVFTAFEYLVSYGMEALFSLKWWDYTEEFMNLNGRVSIFYTFAWGIIAILFINFIYPFFKKKLNILLSKIPYKIQVTAVYILFAVFITDTVLSCIKNLI